MDLASVQPVQKTNLSQHSNQQCLVGCEENPEKIYKLRWSEGLDMGNMFVI